jgi:ferrous iron transport protein B
MTRLILVGNPNVGKSVLFTRLTGIHATVSNYAGTTVTFKKGRCVLDQEELEVLDTPGAYSLDSPNEAERVTAELLGPDDLIINVLDATNLERNLLLTMQLLERGQPLVVALNMIDDARHKGVDIDVAELQRILRVPVIPTVALSGDGVADLVRAVQGVRSQAATGVDFPRIRPHDFAEKWSDLGNIIRRVQSLHHRHHTFLETLEDLSVHPWLGLGFAVLLLICTFAVIRFLGEGLIEGVLDPLFQHGFLPVVQRLYDALGGHPLLRHLLIGELVNGAIDFELSMGMLTTGLYVEFGVVLPYLLVFYLVLSLLEDIGYLPRLGVVMDTFMHHLGLHGFSVIPVLLGFGCNVPGILATRSLETRTQRFIACTLISIGVPCVSLQAMVFKLVGESGLLYVLAVYAFLAAVVVLLGVLLKLATRDAMPEMILEIPPYRRPSVRMTCHKLFHRARSFLLEATPLILGGILLMNILDYFRVFAVIARAISPIVKGVWGLPEAAILPIVMGFLRKDVAAGMLVPLQLTTPQLMTACVLLSLTFPCVATLAVLFSELGWRDALKSVAIMLVTSVLFGGIAHLFFQHLAG